RRWSGARSRSPRIAAGRWSPSSRRWSWSPCTRPRSCARATTPRVRRPTARSSPTSRWLPGSSPPGSASRMKIGYFLSCEERAPRELVEMAKRAQEAGFHALWISDHYHPWNDEQGHSAFVWSVIGALAEATSLPVPTGVTCPPARPHPPVIAQAAATSAVLLEGRFNLG